MDKSPTCTLALGLITGRTKVMVAWIVIFIHALIADRSELSWQALTLAILVVRPTVTFNIIFKSIDMVNMIFRAPHRLDRIT